MRPEQSKPLGPAPSHTYGLPIWARAYEIAHDAYEDFVRSLGFTYREWFENESWGVPIRKSECEHLRPIRPGDEISVKVSIESLGESSFTNVYEISATGAVASVVKITHVFMDVKTKKKMTKAMKDSCNQVAARECVHH